MRRAWMLCGIFVLLVWAGVAVGQVGPASVYHVSNWLCTSSQRVLVGGSNTRIGLRIINLGAETMWVGGANLSQTNGWPIHAGALMAGQAHAFVLMGPEASAELSCIAAGSVDVRVFQIFR